MNLIKSAWGRVSLPALSIVALLVAPWMAPGADFRRDVLPLLEKFCWDCHADGADKGGVAFDGFKSDAAALDEHDLWWKALKNLRADIMPPPRKPRPSDAEKRLIEGWIKQSVFAQNPEDPDPGRVTVRRLNRVEYRNTIRDLMGVDFDTDKEFPPDDAGHGFDNIGDVLTLSPMLLEKYLAAAQAIVARGVPAVPAVPAEQGVVGRRARASTNNSPLNLSYYESRSVTNRFDTGHDGRYQLVLDLTANERYVDNQFDYNKCRLVLRLDGMELHSREYAREGGKAFQFEFDQELKAGGHEVVLEAHPVAPAREQVRSLTLRINAVTVRGPMDERFWVRPPNHERFFPGAIPATASGRRDYARQLLQEFARKAYRRPVDSATIDRLVDLAETIYSQKGKTFEAGIGQSMVAVLASPRFLFREEGAETAIDSVPSGRHPFVDEYSLASRLSYFLWSSMPDDELLRLADGNRLRSGLAEQTRRMLADAKSDELIRNFVGQWLQARDIERVTIDARQVLNREAAADPEQERRRNRFRELRDKPEDQLTADEKQELETIRGTFRRRFGRQNRAELTGDLRRAMRQESEKVFEHVLREDRRLVELLDSDYTFLNERLAAHYGLTNLNIKGDAMQRVTLPPESPRGGVLTQGTILAVTSNPTRTSPVKRGLFILDNLLGTPPPPPPPDIPPLEDAAKAMKEKTLSLRETLALHREQPLCSSCHNRMDPLGLALENFNAMGMWREQEQGQAIDAGGTLLSGEKFTHIRQLKRILATQHATEFHRTVTEKLLTYALGRGLEYHDVASVDAIVERLERTQGRPSELLSGIIQSAPFQKTRRPVAVDRADDGLRRVDQAARKP